MTTNDFVKSYIEDFDNYELSSGDRNIIKHEGLQKFIFNKLNSSKFKASATSEDYLYKIKDKITLSIDHNLPVTISFPFGATKNPYAPTAPGVDWAEVFNIAYMIRYLSPIASAYKFGAVLEYVSVAVFEEKVNRIPQKDIDLYDKEFTGLTKFFQKYLPSKFQLKYTRVGDLIDQKEINRLIDIKKDQLKKVWNKQSKETIESKLFRARRNTLLDPGDKNVDAILLESALGHDAFCSECWTTDLAPWDKKYMITLGNNYTSGWAIHVRSTPGSSVNFWSGTGVLEKRIDHFVPNVLSPLQYKAASNGIVEEKVDLFATKYSNLSSISVLNKK